MQGLTWNKKTTRSLTAESAELAWERAELAWDSLGGLDVRENEHTILIQVLDGIAEFFQWGQKGGLKKSNMRKKKNSIHRRLKAEERDQIKDGDEKKSRLSALKNNPLAAGVLVLIGMLSIVASFIASSDSRRLNRMAQRYEGRNIVIDEDEAEILEFYEKEMEAGSFKRMLSFDVMEEEDSASIDNAQQPSNFEEGPLHLRSDTYYTQVLQNTGDSNFCATDQCHRDEPVQELVNAPSSPRNDLLEESQESCQGSTPDDFYDCESNQSPQQSQNESLSSSISSLTSELYPEDIKTSFSFSTVESEEDLPTASTPLAIELCQQLPQDLNHTNSPLHSESKHTIISATADTPLIGNVFHNGRNAIDVSSRPQLKRRVSFNPEVKVKEIPRQEVKDQFSSERYLYFMLFTVGIVIAIFSFLPAHPSLSPIASMTRTEVFRRADSILSSQFDVEL